MNKRWPYGGKRKHRSVHRLSHYASVSEPNEYKASRYRKRQKGGTIMQRFWDLVKDSTIVQGAITLGVVGVTCYLWGTGQPVPQELWTANGIILGFFFGSKTAHVVRNQS